MSINYKFEINLFEVLFTALLWHLYCSSIIPVVYPIIGTALVGLKLIGFIVWLVLFLKAKKQGE